MSFYDELSKYYDIVFPPGDAQMKFIKKRLGDGKNILDLAAGTGNYSIALANLGCCVTAVDLDEEMVKYINEKRVKNHLNIKGFKLDMKNIDNLNEKFDFIMCIGNSLVHLENLQEIKDVILKLYNLLNEDGIIVIQIVNYDRILKYDIKELPTIDRSEKGVKFIRKYEVKENKVLFNGKLVVNKDNNEQVYDNTVELYPLQSDDLVNTLKSVGMNKVDIYGNFNEEEHNIDSFATVVAAYK